MGVLLADGEEDVPRGRAGDGVHQPLADGLDLGDSIRAVLEVAVDVATASAGLDLEALVDEEDEERERAQVPLLGRGREEALGLGAREEVGLEQLAGPAERGGAAETYRTPVRMRACERWEWYEVGARPCGARGLLLGLEAHQRIVRVVAREP